MSNDNILFEGNNEPEPDRALEGMNAFKRDLAELESDLTEALEVLRNDHGLKLRNGQAVVAGGALQSFQERYGVQLKVWIHEGDLRLECTVLPQSRV